MGYYSHVAEKTIKGIIATINKANSEGIKPTVEMLKKLTGHERSTIDRTLNMIKEADEQLYFMILGRMELKQSSPRANELKAHTERAAAISKYTQLLKLKKGGMPGATPTLNQISQGTRKK